MIDLNNQTRHFIKLLGIVLVIALIFTILPRFVFASLSALFGIIVWIMFIFILWRLFGHKIGPAVDKYTRKYSRPSTKSKTQKKRDQKWFSDRR